MMTISRSAARPLLPVLLVPLAVLAGCGGGDKDSTVEGATAAPKTLKVLQSGQFLTLDPNQMTSLADWNVAGLYAGTLTEYSAGAQGKPSLAQEVVSNKDFTKWTVTLKPGLKFSDGSTITAQDVKATFDSVLKARGLGLLFAPDLASVSTRGRTTAIFSFKGGEPSFPTAMSAPSFAIYPAAGLKKGAAFFERPVSAGPYVVDSYKPQSVTLSRNRYYAGTKPGPEAVRFNTVADPGTALAQVKTGQANIAVDLPGSLIPQMNSGARKQLNNLPGNYMMLLNNKDKLLADVKIRRAINFALDRKAISDTGFGGEAKPNSRYWPAPFSEFRAAQDEEQQLTSDVDSAKRELQGTACEKGCSVDVVGSSSFPWMSPVQLLVQQQLKAVGIDVKARTGDGASVLKQQSSSQFQILIDRYNGWTKQSEFLPFTNMDGSGPIGAFFTKFDNKEATDLTARMREAPAESRGPLAKAIDDVHAREVPWVDLADNVVISATNLPDSLVHGELMVLKVK